jgi:hypothetical protein
MVDFNSEATVSVSAIDILRILILQRRNDVIDSIETYKKIEKHSNPEPDIVRSRLFSLFLEIDAMLKRRVKKEEYEQIEKDVDSEDFKTLLKLFRQLNRVLDEMRLTRIDIKQVYDSTRTASEDKEKGV